MRAPVLRVPREGGTLGDGRGRRRGGCAVGRRRVAVAAAVRQRAHALGPAGSYARRHCRGGPSGGGPAAARHGGERRQPAPGTRRHVGRGRAAARRDGARVRALVGLPRGSGPPARARPAHGQRGWHGRERHSEVGAATSAGRGRWRLRFADPKMVERRHVVQTDVPAFGAWPPIRLPTQRAAAGAAGCASCWWPYRVR